MNAVEKLQYLSLVNKVCQELDHHLGVSDKTLAEFIIDLAKTHKELPAFRAALEENGLDLSGAGRVDSPSGQGLVFLQPDGALSSVVVAGSNAAWPAQAIAQMPGLEARVRSAARARRAAPTGKKKLKTRLDLFVSVGV